MSTSWRAWARRCASRDAWPSSRDASTCTARASSAPTFVRALVIAGLQADGLTRISRIEHIDRGYESIERDLGVLGAHVRRETGT